MATPAGGYDRSAILRDAHKRYRDGKRLGLGWSWSQCLSTAWAAAKQRRALDLEKLFAEDAKKRQGQRNDLKPQNIVADLRQCKDGKSSEQAAKVVGASGRGVQMAKKVAAVAPDLANAVKAGSTSLDAEDAKKRQQEHAGTAPGKPKTLVADLPQVKDAKSREQAAKVVGASGRGVIFLRRLQGCSPPASMNRPAALSASRRGRGPSASPNNPRSGRLPASSLEKTPIGDEVADCGLPV